MTETVLDGETGLHFDSTNPADLAEKARWLWTHPETCRQFGADARQHYETYYTQETNYTQLQDIYRQTIQRRAQARARVLS